MSRIWPVILLVGTGVALLFGGCSHFHWQGSVPEYRERVYRVDSSSKIQNISLQDTDTPISICPSDDETMYLSYFVPDNDEAGYCISEADGELKISKEEKANMGIFIFGDQAVSDSSRYVELKLYLPVDRNYNISIKSLDGSIRVGEVEIATLAIDTQDGNVNFYKTDILQSLNLSTNDGDVSGTLRGRQSDYSCDMESENGGIYLQTIGNHNKVIQIRTKDGEISVSFDDRSLGNG